MARFIEIQNYNFSDARPFRRWVNCEAVVNVSVLGPTLPLEVGEKPTSSRCWRVGYGFASATHEDQVEIYSSHGSEESAMREVNEVMGTSYV